MKIIVGLGNPGEKYAKTRHNVGFRIVSALADELKITPDNMKYKSLIGQGRIAKERIVLAQPCTYMNKSGQAVKALVDGYQVELKDLIVIYDDLDLPPGKIRIKKSGSSGGHNGIKSIINRLGTRDFSRIRIGIGRPPEGIDVVDYVLGYFTDEENELITEATSNAIEAIKVIQKETYNKAMNKFN